MSAPGAEQSHGKASIRRVRKQTRSDACEGSLCWLVHGAPFVSSSDARENWQGGVSGRGAEDTRADQEANAWGRNGGDPNRYRPPGLPSKY